MTSAFHAVLQGVGAALGVAATVTDFLPGQAKQYVALASIANAAALGILNHYNTPQGESVTVALAAARSDGEQSALRKVQAGAVDVLPIAAALEGGTTK